MSHVHWHRGDPDTDPKRRASLMCRYVVGTNDKVVSRFSAATLASFADLDFLSCGHLALVKPRDRDDPIYVLIARFLRATEERSARGVGESALQDLTYRLRRVSLNGRWDRKEVMHIRLDHSERPHWLQCQVRIRRWDGLARSQFKICCYLTGHQPDQEVDFSWEIGRGNLSEEEFGAVAGELSEFLEVESLTLHQEGEIPYEAHEPSQGPGWIVMPFETSRPIREERPYEQLELKFSGRVDRRQGWYLVELERTVAERFEVVFEAPFKARYINFLSPNARFEGPTLAGTHFIHRVSTSMPLPIGRSVVWVYPEEEENG